MNPSKRLPLTCAFFLAAVFNFDPCCLLAEEGAESGQPIDFVKQVAPILEHHCIRCHSVDVSKGDVSFTTSVQMESQSLLVPGDPDSSHLLDVVQSIDGQPPEMPKEGSPLSASEVEVLYRWIKEGADWPVGVELRERSKADGSWWSLQPIATVVPPESSESNPIDRFVFSKLAEHGLRPSRQADRGTLIRRIYFDLIGLPPSPDDVRTFVGATDEHAYESLVDRLLASKDFGQRWARHWLDIAHYADTHGFERDQRRDNAWRYRDYVIRSFNHDKPYDQFIREQIAGDVLSPDDPEAVIATGFLAAGPFDFVGQVETQSSSLRRAARAADLDDMLTQVMTSTIGMTVNCARCHDHKLDPITQSEYYELTAIFAGLKRADRDTSATERKVFDAETSRLKSAMDGVSLKLAKMKASHIDLADVVGGGNGYGTGKKGHGIDVRSGKIQPSFVGDLENIKAGEYSRSQLPLIDGVFVPASGETQISSTGLVAHDLPKHSGKGWDGIRNGPVNSQFSTALGSIDFASPGHSMIGLHANAGITFDLGALRKSAGFADVCLFTTTVGYGGQPPTPSADFWILVDGELQSHAKLGRNDTVSVALEITPDKQFLTLVSTDGGDGYSMDQISYGDPRLADKNPKVIDAATIEQIVALEQELQRLDQEFKSLVQPAVFYGIVAEQPPETKVLVRGNPETPGESVNPGTLRFGGARVQFGPAEMSDSERRIALANWITDPSNPLTARVIVNRLWHWHFGRGIVGTPSDFGFGGERPSHPELLDWLAAELLRSKWSLKHIHRLIVTAKTYQMTSRIDAFQPDADRSQQKDQTQDARSIDVDNRLLWRMNTSRLPAESIRDAVLSITGKLNSQMDGPGYRDFDYEEAYAPIYTYKTADEPELWRRSIYRYIVRTTPQQFLLTLDCPDPANLTPRRSVTTTALQSLALFNNEFMLLQSRYFAERLEREAASQDAQIELAFQLAFGRSVSADEREAAKSLMNQYGLMHLCRVLFNASEFVNVD